MRQANTTVWLNATTNITKIPVPEAAESGTEISASPARPERTAPTINRMTGIIVRNTTFRAMETDCFRLIPPQT